MGTNRLTLIGNQSRAETMIKNKYLNEWVLVSPWIPKIRYKALAAILKEVTKEKGEITLFGLFLREEAPNVWDLVVAGPEFEKDQTETLSYFIRKIKAHFLSDELMSLSRVTILEADNPILAAILNAIPAGQKKTVFRNEDFLGLEIKRAYVLKVKRPQTNGKMQTTKKPRQRTAPARRRLAAAR